MEQKILLLVKGLVGLSGISGQKWPKTNILGQNLKNLHQILLKLGQKLQNWVPYGLVQVSMPEKFVFGVNPLNPLKTIENNRTPRSNAF